MTEAKGRAQEKQVPGKGPPAPLLRVALGGNRACPFYRWANSFRHSEGLARGRSRMAELGHPELGCP